MAGKGLKDRVERLEKELILKALSQSHGIQVHAAKALGINERVLRYKIKKYGLKITTQLSFSNNIVGTYESRNLKKNI